MPQGSEKGIAMTETVKTSALSVGDVVREEESFFQVVNLIDYMPYVIIEFALLGDEPGEFESYPAKGYEHDREWQLEFTAEEFEQHMERIGHA